MSDVLLIDDDVHANTVIRAALEMFGHHVRTSDGTDLEKTVCGPTPNVALVDLLLPGCSGMDLLRTLHAAHPQSFLVLATGMADVNLLAQAVAAGASSMLCKPYHISDVVQLIELSALLAQAMVMEVEDDCQGASQMRFARSGKDAICAGDLARLVAFARSHGADETTAWRLAEGAGELLRNAREHGARRAADRQYEVMLSGSQGSLELRVVDDGPGFDWWKEIARARSGMEKARASGIQIALAVADSLDFEDQGRTAIARFKVRHADTGNRK